MWEIGSNRDRTLLEGIDVLPGVGEKRAEVFGKMGISSVADVAMCLPRRYIHRGSARPISEIEIGEAATVSVVVGRAWQRKGMLHIEIEDESGGARAIFFNAPVYLRSVLVEGRRVLMWGKTKLDDGKPLFLHPDFEVEGEGKEAFIPVYPNAAEFHRARIGVKMRAKIARAAAEIAARLPDPIPESIVDSRGLMPFGEALLELHSPSSWDAIESARRRFAFDELLLLQIVFALRRRAASRDRSAVRLRPGRLFGAVRSSLPFELTDGQNRALAGILEGLTRPGRSLQLLTGDVGSGKTVIALLAAAAAIDSGLQVALMVPSLLVARQHAELFNSQLGRFGVAVGLMTGASTSRPLIDGLASGVVDLVIGTQALLSPRLKFKRLGLIIIDEQHRFGVRQRLELPEKVGAHVLLLSATPIPRTSALALYGDLDRYVLEGYPKSRAGSSTYLRTEDARDAVWDFIGERVDAGERGFVVYPRIEGDDLSAAVKAGFASLSERFPGRVALLYGTMPDSEKAAVFAAFRSGERPILAATNLVEVGVDVPEATVMVVEGPESFSLAQLHQLRGRVGRGKRRGYCILISGAARGSVGWGRLERFASTDDGFEIAKIDLEFRGEGDVLRIAQSGKPFFEFADPKKMLKLLEDARECAEAIVSEDPNLTNPENLGLKMGIEYLLKTKDIVRLAV